MDFATETFYDAANKIWHGPLRTNDLYEPQSTLGGEILKALKKYPQQVVQINDDDGIEKTAENLLLESQAIAAEFLSMGLKTGDIIGLYAGNTSNLTAVVIASFFCGTAWHAVYPQFDKDVLKQTLGLTMPKIICCDLENYETLKIALEGMKSDAIVYVINGSMPKIKSIVEILERSSTMKSFDEKMFPGLNLTDADSTAILLCSSGTTGLPKCVTLSHRSMLNNNIFRDVTRESTLFCYNSLFWISGVWTLLASLLNAAKRIVTNRPATPEHFLNLIEKYKITHVFPSTILTNQLVQGATVTNEQRFASLHSLYCGGSKVSLSSFSKIFELFGEINSKRLGPLVCYGMTELGGMVSQTYTQSIERRFDNEGKLMPNMQAKIKDRESDKFLGPNELGFIYIRLPYKWAGYYQNEEATQKVYEQATGWFNSGDVGYFDEKGFLYICGRESDIFRSNGFNIHPNYLEEIISQIPGVAEVCVFGVPHPVAINLPACAIVRTKDAKGLKLTEEAVETSVRQHVTKMFYINGGVYFLEQLPKTASGKLIRRKVYDLIKENS